MIMNDTLTEQETTFSGSLRTKFGASVVIFCISLFAVSFPSLSERVKYVRIPTIAFFLGKHFGTGVILSTAFVHLLADAFKSLQSEWTGLVVLVSLLAIFLVEYLSTAYVDYLHSYPSEPPSPADSETNTPAHSRPESLSSSRTPQENSTHILQYDSDASKQMQFSSPLPDDHAETPAGLETTPLTSSRSSFSKTYGTHDALPHQPPQPPTSTEAEHQAVVAFPQHSCQNTLESDDEIPTIALRSTVEPDDECTCKCRYHRRDAELIPASSPDLSKGDTILAAGDH
ncbi:hypothetical protein NM688_g8619 [Phlebia brevispora]|uniref:Uncharacterized protein n=1 Tax=Phlebia brevispora TaxID=194682 RepID=A0ACC1RPL0_9APHY|nr:hypothetical protein NM688_g8619 [Phlebia brevispora]